MRRLENENKHAKSSKFLSPPQVDSVLRNFAPRGTDFAKAQNPRSNPRGILRRITHKEERCLEGTSYLD
jgi:hypothetical protein